MPDVSLSRFVLFTEFLMCVEQTAKLQSFTLKNIGGKMKSFGLKLTRGVEVTLSKKILKITCF